MEAFRGLNAVVTGGGGFMGSHLVERLLNLGAKVLVLDSFAYGNKICSLEGHENLSIYRADVRDKKMVYKAAENADVVFHFASLVGVEETYQHPIEVLDVEIKGTVNVLNSALNHDIKRIIFASSSEVYGSSPIPVSEEAPFTCKSTYAYAKLIGEEYCRAYHQEHGIGYVCLRYFNVYGPRQDERFVIPRFVKRVSQNKPPLIYGDGNQTRDFTYVEDAVDITILAAIKPEAKCETINVGTGVNVTINRLAYLVIKILKKENAINPVYINYSKKRPQEIEVYNRVSEISKAKRMFGYEPKVPLEMGIKRYIDWYFKYAKNKVVHFAG